MVSCIKSNHDILARTLATLYFTGCMFCFLITLFYPRPASACRPMVQRARQGDKLQSYLWAVLCREDLCVGSSMPGTRRSSSDDPPTYRLSLLLLSILARRSPSALVVILLPPWPR